MFCIKQNQLHYVPFFSPLRGFYFTTFRKMEDKTKQNKKGGRPPKEIKREFLMGFNATQYEKLVIQEKAKQSGLRIAEYLRQAAMNGKITRRPTAEEIQLYRNLTGLSNNLNQLTKEAHQQGLIQVIPKVLKTLDEVNKLITAINDNQNQDR